MKDFATDMRAGMVGFLMSRGIVPHKIDQIMTREFVKGVTFVQQYGEIGKAGTRHADAAKFYELCREELKDQMQDAFFTLMVDGSRERDDVARHGGAGLRNLCNLNRPLSKRAPARRCAAALLRPGLVAKQVENGFFLISGGLRLVRGPGA